MEEDDEGLIDTEEGFTLPPLPGSPMGCYQEKRPPQQDQDGTITNTGRTEKDIQAVRKREERDGNAKGTMTGESPQENCFGVPRTLIQMRPMHKNR